MKLEELLKRAYTYSCTGELDTIISEDFNIYRSLNVEVPKSSKVPIYVPCIRGVKILKDMLETPKECLPDKYSIALHVLGTVDRKTFNSIVLNTLNMSSPRIVKCTVKDDTFYAGKGIILDENFKLLLLMAFEVVINSKDGLTEVETKRPVCFIDSSIFANKNDYISKNIVKKLIPEIVSLRISYVLTNTFFNYNPISHIPKLIVDDLDSIFISEVNAPTSIENIQEDLNEYLVENMNEVLDSVV